MFSINGEQWRLLFVPSNHVALLKPNGKFAIGACDDYTKTIYLDENVSQKEVIDCIKEGNADKNIHGILVQMPLPKHMDAKAVVDAIDPLKDVDGLHALNQGKLLLSEKGIIPATPKGVMRLLSEYCVDLEGKNAIVIGRSMLVGKPSHDQ